MIWSKVTILNNTKLVYYTIVCFYTCITHTCKDNLIDEINDSIFCTLILVQQFVYLWLDRPIYVSQFLLLLLYYNLWPIRMSGLHDTTHFSCLTISWNLYIANWTSHKTGHRYTDWPLYIMKDGVIYNTQHVLQLNGTVQYSIRTMWPFHYVKLFF